MTGMANANITIYVIAPRCLRQLTYSNYLPLPSTHGIIPRAAHEPELATGPGGEAPAMPPTDRVAATQSRQLGPLRP